MDDLHIYNLNKLSWSTIEQDSPRKIERKQSPDDNRSDKSAEKRDKKKKNWYESVGAGLNAVKNSSSSPLTNSSKQKVFSTVYHNEETGSPVKMIDEQRKKAFYQKKAEMLKNF